MRVVIATLHHYPDLPGGAMRLADGHARYLSRLGHEVWIVAQDISHTKPESAVDDGLHVLRYPAPRLSAFDPRRRLIHQTMTRELLERHVPAPVDYVHGHSLLQYEGAMMAYARTGVRTSYSVHSPVLLEILAASRDRSIRQLRLWASAILAHRVEARCLKASTEITVDSEYTRTLLRRLHGPRVASRARVIPGWADAERFRVIADRARAKAALGWPVDRPVFFTLRRLVPRMGLDNLIRSMSIVRKAGHACHLVIGGCGPQQEHLQQLASLLELDACVRFLGRVPDPDLPQMYGAADAFLLPTARLECFGLIALEAMACGRPVLATPIGAIPEVVAKFEPRWISRNAGAHALAERVIDFLKGRLPAHDPEVLHEYVAQHYSSEVILPRLCSMLSDNPGCACAQEARQPASEP